MKLGLAYRPEFKDDWDKLATLIEIVEVMPEWYEEASNKQLQDLRGQFDGLEIHAHALSLNLGSTQIPRGKAIRRFMDILDLSVISDHFSFMSTEKVQLGNFLPPILSPEGLELMAKNLELAERFLDRKVQIENIVYFTPWPDYIANEARAIKMIAAHGGGLLLDVNNLYVNSVNHQFDPFSYIDEVANVVKQIHVAGHAKARGHLVDSHMDPISSSVFELLAYAIQKTSADAVVLERDNASASTNELIHELSAIRKVIDSSSETLSDNRTKRQDGISLGCGR